jgi:DNA-binding NarL/FixJ family response regulator
MKKDIIIADEIDEQISKLPLAPNVELTCDPMSNFIMDMDIRTTVDSLSKTEVQEVAFLLLDGYTIRDIASKLNIPKSTLFSNQVKQLKEVFQKFYAE